MTKLTKISLALTATFTLTMTAAFGQFSFDEKGNGFGPGGPIPGVIAIDPLTGQPALCYQLPFAPAPGDVLLTEQASSQVSDVLRFFQNTLYFYSLRDDASDTDLADVAILPPLQPNVAGPFFENGPEGNNGFVWLPPPGSGAPGDVGFPVQYNFISDVPEPGSLSLAGVGCGVALLLRLRRQASRG